MLYYKKNPINYKNLGDGYLFESGIGVNPTAFEIYNLCEGGKTFNDIWAQFANEYDLNQIDTTKVKEEIRECLTDLTEGKLINIINNDGGGSNENVK